ncbi:MAG: trimeric intracellular cation channel family protein [Thioalkalivibrio sp.]
MLYYFDLIGVAVFAASGVLAARDRNLDIFGLIMVATFTAIGGGTIRDLLLDRHPIFWVVDPWYLVVIIASAITTIVYLKWRPPPGRLFLLVDTLGLALFAMSGATLALAAGHSPLIVIIMGVMTGTMGGMLRDVITARVPLILQKEIYATAALCGVVVYLLAVAAGVNDLMAFCVGFSTVVALRLIAIRWGINLPVIRV